MCHVITDELVLNIGETASPGLETPGYKQTNIQHKEPRWQLLSQDKVFHFPWEKEGMQLLNDYN